MYSMYLNVEPNTSLYMCTNAEVLRESVYTRSIEDYQAGLTIFLIL